MDQWMMLAGLIAGAVAFVLIGRRIALRLPSPPSDLMVMPTGPIEYSEEEHSSLILRLDHNFYTQDGPNPWNL